jgi:hypothetical protein
MRGIETYIRATLRKAATLSQIPAYSLCIAWHCRFPDARSIARSHGGRRSTILCSGSVAQRAHALLLGALAFSLIAILYSVPSLAQSPTARARGRSARRQDRRLQRYRLSRGAHAGRPVRQGDRDRGRCARRPRVGDPRAHPHRAGRRPRHRRPDLFGLDLDRAADRGGRVRAVRRCSQCRQDRAAAESNRDLCR